MQLNINDDKNALTLLLTYFQQYQKQKKDDYSAYSKHLKNSWDNILSDWSKYSTETRFQLMVIYNEYKFKLLNLQDPRFKNPSMDFFYNFEQKKWEKMGKNGKNAKT